MTPECDAKFEEKLTCMYFGKRKIATGIWEIFTSARESLKTGTLLRSFIQSRKYMSLKLTGELCVMTTKNDAKFEKKLTWEFKTDIRNLTNLDTSTQKSQKFVL